jgi:hypothetical protein
VWTQVFERSAASQSCIPPREGRQRRSGVRRKRVDQKATVGRAIVLPVRDALGRDTRLKQNDWPDERMSGFRSVQGGRSQFQSLLIIDLGSRLSPTTNRVRQVTPAHA